MVLEYTKRHLHNILPYQVPGEKQNAGVETEGRETNAGKLVQCSFPPRFPVSNQSPWKHESVAKGRLRE